MKFYINIFKNYNFHYCALALGKVGGIGIFVKIPYVCSEIISLKLPTSSDCPVESLWLEIDSSTCKYIIGGIYRHPGHSINTFCRELESSLESVRRANIPCVIAGDFNIDLAKYNSNRDTNDYLNTVLLNNFMPMIILPTCITKKSSTLIDHIYYYEGSNNSEVHDIVSGNFWSDLTDHLPNYFLITSNRRSKKSECPLVRIFSERNVNDFKSRLSSVEWDHVYNCTDKVH